MPTESRELKNTSYELFIGALSVLSIVNLVLIVGAPDPNVAATAAAMDLFLTIIFLVDFLYRLFSAESKTQYFLRQFGWADLLASLPLPQAKILRLFRIVRVYRLMREFGLRPMIAELVGNRAGSALLSVLLFLIVLLEFGGILMIKAESQSPDANIKSASDAIWWAYVTMTTVGYGDRYPVTDVGRAVGMLVMAAGVGLFGVLTGFLANAFLSPKDSDEEEDDAADAALAAQVAQVLQLLEEQRELHGALVGRLDAIDQVLRALEHPGSPDVST